MSGNFGRYIAPNNTFTIEVPLRWRLTDKINALEIVSPQGKAAVIVTVYHQTTRDAETDARKHLQRFLSTRDVKGKAILVLDSASRAMADFTDQFNRQWRTVFMSKTCILILATCTSSPASRKDLSVAQSVLKSIRIPEI